ncbi:MAG: hypothetical protein ACPLRW_07310 [Moorellales bacterium]
MWDGKVPTIWELHAEGKRLGRPKAGWRVYLWREITWVTRLTIDGTEYLYAGIDPDGKAIWLNNLRLGDLILEAAGVR